MIIKLIFCCIIDFINGVNEEDVVGFNNKWEIGFVVNINSIIISKLRVRFGKW